jgi:hypothetical protein
MMMLPAAQIGTRQRTQTKAIISPLLIYPAPDPKSKRLTADCQEALASLLQISSRWKTPEEI